MSPAKCKNVIVALFLVAVGVLSIPSTAHSLGYTNQVTITSTITFTQYTSTTQTFTTTAFTGSLSMLTSTIRQTISAQTTTTPIQTKTVANVGTTTIYQPTTVFTKLGPPSATIAIQIDRSPVTLNQAYQAIITIRNTGTSPISGNVVVSENLNGDPQQTLGPQNAPWTLNAQVNPSTGHPSSISLAPGASTIVYQGFTDSWNWVAPVSTTDDLWNILITLISNVFGVLSPGQIINLINAILAGYGFDQGLLGTTGATIINEYKQPLESYTIRADLTSVGGTIASGQQVVSVEAGDMKETAWSWTIDTSIASLIAAVAGIIILVLVSGGALSTVLAFIMGAVNAVLLGASLATYHAAQDPDIPFNLVPGQQTPIPPTIASLPEGPAKQLGVAAIRVGDYISAFSKGINMYYAAARSSDSQHELEALNAASAGLSGARDQVNLMLQAYQGIRQYVPVINSTDIQIARNYVSTSGLPTEFNQILSEMGLSSYESTLKRILASTPNEIGEIPFEGTLSSMRNSISTESAQLNQTRAVLQNRMHNPAMPLQYQEMGIILGAFAIVAVYAFHKYRRPVGTQRAEGAKVSETCPNCGQVVDGEEYCENCGQRLRYT